MGFATYFEVNFDAVDEEEYDDDEQQDGVAPVENVRIQALVVRGRLGKVRDHHFGQKEPVAQNVERHKAQEGFRQELRLVPANIAKVKRLKTSFHLRFFAQ